MGPLKPRNIILVTIDTLRADRVGCYGCPRPTTPVLDSLAREGAVFSRAYAAAPYTVPSHVSMLTGLYPSNHDLGLVQKEGRLDTGATVTLQEMLRMNGYRTGAFVSSFVLRKSFGLDAGFEVYDDEMTGTELNRESQPIRDGRETNRAALEWFGTAAREGAFMWVHYFDAHGPYVQPADFGPGFRAEDYGDGPVRLPLVADGLPGGIPAYQALDAGRDTEGNITSFEDDMRAYLAGYDNGVRYQDSVVGGLIDGLKGMGAYDDSLIVVTSDHGEALGEDGVYFFHGLTVTPDQTAVPLIVKPHTGYGIGSSGLPVSTIDVMPTILDAAGVDRSGLRIDGASLASPVPGRLVQSENEWQRALAGAEGYLVSGKDVLYDGYEYYFDARSLCGADRLFDAESGTETEPAREKAPLLYGRLDLLKSESDPKERKVKARDRKVEELDAAVRRQARELKSRDDIIAFKEKSIKDTAAFHEESVARLQGEIRQRDEVMVKKMEELNACKTEAHGMKAELESILNSSSWKLTYPLRWLSARIKGGRPRN